MPHWLHLSTSRCFWWTHDLIKRPVLFHHLQRRCRSSSDRDRGSSWELKHVFLSASVPPRCPSEEHTMVPWPGSVGTYEDKGEHGGSLITEAQRGPMAVAPAAGHLGAFLTPTLSKNKKEEKRGPTVCSLQPPGPRISGPAQMGRWIHIAACMNCANITAHTCWFKLAECVRNHN